MNSRQVILFICSTVILLSGCTDAPSFQTYNYQAVSALGDTLYAPQLAPDTEARFTTNLETARANYLANPEDPDNLIWYGRRTAYLGNYRKAIDIFSKGIQEHPEDPRMYRHRAHRYITVREFGTAIQDLENASQLIEGTRDQIEPDGLPNEKDKPRSTLHTNIWYHLGLGYYLQNRFKEASQAFQNCLDISTNDDMRVATTYWLYMSLRRAGYDLEAGRVLDPIKEDMNLLENESYHRLLLVFKGIFKPEMILEETTETDPLQNATVGYGLGNWHYINGRTASAQKFWKQVYENGQWAAFGYIAAETDLKQLR